MSFSAVQTNFGILASNKAFAAEREKHAHAEKRRYIPNFNEMIWTILICIVVIDVTLYEDGTGGRRLHLSDSIMGEIHKALIGWSNHHLQWTRYPRH